MENIISFLNICSILILLIYPFGLKKIVFKYFINNSSYYLLLVITSILFVLLFAYWSYYSKIILLKHYGFVYPCLGVDGDCYSAVDDFEKVKQLRKSIKGIGWPLRAFFQMHRS